MLDHLEKILMTNDIEAIWTQHCRMMAQYGFDRLIYAFLPFRDAPGRDDVADALFLSNHDPDYLRCYLQNNSYLESPMVKWMMHNTGVRSWGDILRQMEQRTLTPEERARLEMNRAFGVTAGYSITFEDSSSRSTGGIGLCAERGLTQAEVDDIWSRHGRELMVLNSVLHLKISTMPLVTARRALTARQREVLEWVADGKTTADIALIMGLTVATVEKHLRRAREVLDVETTAQAVLKASMQKQLFQRNNHSGAIAPARQTGAAK
ncbi:helix-turn-helix transcriptional regulator [Paenirhodobacter sp.]|uniref:helix-turn-helix transcriptional regulator n=1 Tax=Paenirhodobacter sp. TaxID=1965326 RepID=UPI003B3F3E35